MSTRTDSIVSVRTTCAVCSGEGLESAADLPGLPLTGLFASEPPSEPVKGIDQALLVCPDCGHGQLERMVSPKVLYGDDYHFRTSASISARSGMEVFLEMLDEVGGGRRFRCVLDVGCSDLYLLNLMKGRAKRRIGIDPIWAGREETVDASDLTLIGRGFEEIDPDRLAREKPDLVFCRHTLEHMGDPRAVVEGLLGIASDDALFLVEVPGFDSLIEKGRFHQVFHQHLQYFSRRSLGHMIEDAGGKPTAFRENYHHWGALILAFTKEGSGGGVDESAGRRITVASAARAFRRFREGLGRVGDHLLSIEGARLLGYGASQMLPVLAYHLETDMSSFEAILDDDPEKDGTFYANLPVAIRHSGLTAGLEDATILVTAIDNARSIMGKLLELEPRNIILPLWVI